METQKQPKIANFTVKKGLFAYKPLSEDPFSALKESKRTKMSVPREIWGKDFEFKFKSIE